MARRAYARRYAQAVFEIALEAKELEKWQTDLREVVSAVGEASFAAFLSRPKIRFGDKAKLLAERLKGVSSLALNLVYLLIARGRLELIGEIAEDYQRLLDNYHGIEHAEVTTAIPLKDDEGRVVARYLEDMAEKKLVMKSEVDSALIGGIVARIGGKLLDGSTRTRLDTLKKELAEMRR